MREIYRLKINGVQTNPGFLTFTDLNNVFQCVHVSEIILHSNGLVLIKKSLSYMRE